MSDSFTKDELEVAQILLELNDLIPLSGSFKKKGNWGRKGIRSAVVNPPPPSRAPALPSPSVQRTQDKIEANTNEDNGGGSGSPNTPLSFPLSEEKYPEHSSKTSSKKRSIEKNKAMVKELTQSIDVLTGELERVKKHYNELSSFNSQLKAFKQKVLSTSLSGNLNRGTKLAQYPPITVVAHPQPLIADPTTQNSSGPITVHFQSSGLVNHVGPSGIDLNIPAEEFSHGVDPLQPLDAIRAEADQRARSAEARRRRVLKMKATMR